MVRSAFLQKFLWLIPVLVAFGVYSAALGNFFVYDDFIWLYRARNLAHDWQQLFSVDVIYFDPLVYLTFYADAAMAGLDPRWYQSVDLTVHALNAFLVYRVAGTLSEDERTGLYAGVLFASSYAAADAVLWPSSRVDLFAVLFSLAALLHFLRHLRSGEGRFLLTSLLFFVLSLGAKGTPLVLPLVLCWLLFLEKRPLRGYLAVAPFAAVAAAYLALLYAALHGQAHPMGGHLNLRNFCLALSELVIPERHLASLDPVAGALVVAALFAAFGGMPQVDRASARTRSTGLVTLAVALLPVLVLKDFKLATQGREAISLLLSPSHRIYLATAGSALVCAGVLRALETRLAAIRPRGATAACALVLAGLVLYHGYEVRERNGIWQYVGNATRVGLDALIARRGEIVEDGVVVLVQYPGSRGFMEPMIKTFLGVKRIEVLQVFNADPIYDPTVMEKWGKSSLFRLGAVDGQLLVLDLTEQLRKALHACQEARLDPRDALHAAECRAGGRELEEALQQR